MTENAQSNPLEDLAKLRRSPNAMAAWQNALQYLQSGRTGPALASYHHLTQQFPGVPQLWAELGLAATGELEFGLADQSFQHAMELAPNDSNLLVFIGTQYYQLRRIDQAFACLKRAVAVDPSSANARLTLASWLERTRRLDEAWECTEACLAQHPKNGQALYFKAFLLQCKGLNEEAASALRDLLKSDPFLSLDLQANAHHLLGVALDALGQYGEALGSIAKGKALRRQISGATALEQMYDKMDQRRREALADLTPDMLRRWREDASASPFPHPLALIGGAPRSGTTLIEQILAAHPEILVFDEPHAFQREVFTPLNPSPPARGLTLKFLDDLTPAARSQLIGRYMKSLLRETEEKPGSRLLLEKNPSLTTSLHIWLRLLPQTKIVIALRDPRDIVISSYFQNIPVTWGNVSFLTLEKTVKFYSDCMDTWLRMKELGGFEWLETRYEDVVGNLEGEGRRVTNFLGLQWHEAQATFYESARRKFVHSPTYNEVTRPVHKKAVGRWEHYAGALAPFQASLAKYCQAFGYG